MTGSDAMKEICRTCRFYSYPDVAIAKCRRRAPVMAEGKSAFPEVHATDWCGEYEPAEASDETVEFKLRRRANAPNIDDAYDAALKDVTGHG